MIKMYSLIRMQDLKLLFSIMRQCADFEIASSYRVHILTAHEAIHAIGNMGDCPRGEIQPWPTIPHVHRGLY